MNTTDTLKKPKPDKPLKLTKFQKFTAETIDRSLILNAPYNPRVISDAAKKKLRANLKKRGLLETLVVNRTTMHLVSGHQRIGIIDDLMGTPHYLITVAMCEMTEEEEREQNVFMNNPMTQGEYDAGLLTEMFETGLDYSAAGFEIADMAMFDYELGVEDDAPPPDVSDMVDKIKDRKKKAKADSRAANVASCQDCELRIVFQDSDALYDYLESLDLTAEVTFLKFERFEQLMKIRYGTAK